MKQFLSQKKLMDLVTKGLGYLWAYMCHHIASCRLFEDLIKDMSSINFTVGTFVQSKLQKQHVSYIDI